MEQTSQPIIDTNETKKLMTERKEKLEKWEYMLSTIDEYKKRFGKFPSMRNNERGMDNQAAKVLGRWLWLQTVCYRKGTMDPYHIKRLEEIGYKFN